MLNNNQITELDQQIAINKMKEREDRYTYLGLISTYQLYGVKEFSYKTLNPRQHKLFKRVLHGFGAFTKDEVSKMHWDKKRRVKKVWQKGQKIVNAFKQQVANVYANKIFSMFDSCSFITDIPTAEVDYNYVNINTLKELGINYDDLVLVFIQHGLLPKSFFNLK
tara:strand:+ start:1396 stop:1890 length:495 start_codon:yes stop_codon:yes gene_type:complete